MEGLTQGSIVIYADKLWRVGLVNESRARLDPVSGNIHKLLTETFLTYGTSVNISPGSILETVTEDQLSPEQMTRLRTLKLRAGRPEEERIMSGEAAGAGTPVGQPAPPKAKAKAVAAPAAVAQPTLSSAQSKNKARVATQAVEAAQPKVPKEKKAKVYRSCACGCVDPGTGQRTQVGGYFAMGHDARYKSWMMKIERGQMAVKDLPPVVQKEVMANGGWVKNAAGGFTTTKNYKGEVHAGYAPPVTE